MTKFVRDKRTITDTVLKELPFYKEDNRDLEISLNRWWKNIRDDGGLRLTAEGDNAFKMAGIEFWDIRCEDYPSKLMVNTPVGALDLDKYLPCPYYLHYEKATKCFIIRVYDGRVGMMIQLHGSAAKYVESLKPADK